MATNLATVDESVFFRLGFSRRKSPVPVCDRGSRLTEKRSVNLILDPCYCVRSSKIIGRAGAGTVRREQDHMG